MIATSPSTSPSSSTLPSSPLVFTPAATPPPGVIPDFDHPHDYLHTINLVNTCVCLVLVIIFGGIRLYVKVALRSRRGHMLVEDCCFMIAWALCIFFGVGILRLSHYGEGYHLWELSQENYQQFLKWLYVCTVTYIPAAYFTKIALLLLIARVFSVKERVAKALHYFMIALGIAYVPIQVPKVVVCSPISTYWAVTGGTRHCLNQNLLFLADICVALSTDFLILILPIPLVWSMRMMPLWHKIKIIGMLSAGGAATATTAYRVVKIVQYMDSTDPTADFTVLSIFTLLEVAIGLICACLPSLKILIGSLGRASRSPANVPRTTHGWPRARGRVPGDGQGDGEGDGSALGDTLSSTWSSVWARSKLSRRSTAAQTVDAHGRERTAAAAAAARDEESTARVGDDGDTGFSVVRGSRGRIAGCDAELAVLVPSEEDLEGANHLAGPEDGGDHKESRPDEKQV